MKDQTPDYLLDIDLAAAIAAALNLQLNGSSGGVTVSVSNGIVTLEGTVAAGEDRERAERIVRSFTVAGVVNAIAVAAQRTLSRDGRSAKRQKPLRFAEDPPASG
jgi:osmotically-inducible protein OsmY